MCFHSAERDVIQINHSKAHSDILDFRFWPRGLWVSEPWHGEVTLDPGLRARDILCANGKRDQDLLPYKFEFENRWNGKFSRTIIQWVQAEEAAVAMW